MNYKQKLGYMLFGAVIMLIGIAVGSIVSPRWIVQREDVFGEIECAGLTVVDKEGNKAIGLQSHDKANIVSVYDSEGNVAMSLGSIDEVGNGLNIYDKYGSLMVGLMSSSGWDNLTGSGLTIYNMRGKVAVELGSTLRGNEVSVYDSGGKRVGEMVSGTDNWTDLTPWIERRNQAESVK